MDSLTIVALVVLFNFPHVYGFAENRLFLEHGDYLPGHHFRIYHLWLAGLFAATGFLIFAFSRSYLLTASYLVYAPFGVDWVWWVIRYIDIKYRGHNDYDGGTGLPWHSRSDWDNYLGLPLVFGSYWWWYVFGSLSAVLFTLFLVT